MDIPQDIIDNVIAAVGNDDTHLLKQCALVSSSFLLPSRKQLFSSITLRSDPTCQRIYEVLVHNPVIRSFVRTISIEHIIWNVPPNWMDCRSLLTILQLPFCNLEHFSISMEEDCRWGRFSIELRDAFLNIIFSSTNSTLKTLSLRGITELPITLFSHIVHLKTLELNSNFPYVFAGDNSSSPAWAASKVVAPIASHTVDRCVWHLDFDDDGVNPKPIFLPFLCSLRSLKIVIEFWYQSNHWNGLLSTLMDSLCISLTSPATLEHLEFDIRFYGYCDSIDDSFHEKLRDAWSRLDSITTYSSSSQLQRVDINIDYQNTGLDDYYDELYEDLALLLKSVPDGLPILRTKGILFVK